MFLLCVDALSKYLSQFLVIKSLSMLKNMLSVAHFFEDTDKDGQNKFDPPGVTTNEAQ